MRTSPVLPENQRPLLKVDPEIADLAFGVRSPTPQPQQVRRHQAVMTPGGSASWRRQAVIGTCAVLGATQPVLAEASRSTEWFADDNSYMQWADRTLLNPVESGLETATFTADWLQPGTKWICAVSGMVGVVAILRFVYHAADILARWCRNYGMPRLSNNAVRAVIGMRRFLLNPRGFQPLPVDESEIPPEPMTP